MRHQLPAYLGVLKETPAPQPADRLADQLWAEHGWSLTGQDVAGLVIAVLAASILFAL